MAQEQKRRPVGDDDGVGEQEQVGVVPAIPDVSGVVAALSEGAAAAAKAKVAQGAQVPKQPVKRKRRSCCCC